MVLAVVLGISWYILYAYYVILLEEAESEGSGCWSLQCCIVIVIA